VTAIDRRLAALPPSVLRSLKRGLEKEGLRVQPDGRLADTPHPAALGSALTHPRITTDFSEAQLELITGVHTDAESCLRELTELHQAVYRGIGDEQVWCASMPCRLPPDDRIPIAQYGTSNAARLKTLYREGLSRRYGRRMQVISGIHYNFSLPDEAWPHLREGADDALPDDRYRDARYLGLIRNFRRHAWLLLLLLGASPAACGSFAPGRGQDLCTWPSGSVYGPHATSLRMGRLGYQSDAQASLAVSFNDLRGYAATLHRALTEPWPAYEAIGLRDGEAYRQLSTTLLQLENEFYGSIRPKRTTREGERPLRALGCRGIEYLEVRCLDVSPFLPVGIDADTLRLLDIFLLHCLLADSPPDCPREIDAMARNQRLVAERGRDPDTRLDRDGGEVSPSDWGAALLDACGPIAAALDGACGDGRHGEVLSRAQRALREPDTLPSARVLRETEQAHATSFPRFVLERSLGNRDAVMALPFAADAQARLAALAARSLEEQKRIESEDTQHFEDYRLAYLGQDLLSGPHLAD
jgi:glutamate--cysteine ligase